MNPQSIVPMHQWEENVRMQTNAPIRRKYFDKSPMSKPLRKANIIDLGSIRNIIQKESWENKGKLVQVKTKVKGLCKHAVATLVV